MAPTKRKRRSSKHRGNAAGGVELRGRTGRPPTPAERRKASGKDKPTLTRAERMNREPTWAGAATRAVWATAFFVVVLLLAFKEPIATVIPLAVVVLAMYIPLGYFVDKAVYDWRSKKGKR